MPRGRVAVPLAERFWKHVAIGGTDDCWLWQGGRFPNGYGLITREMLPNGRRRLALAHRVAWELTNGPIPDGLHVCHTCDVRYALLDKAYRLCCNPAHAFLGTAGDNVHDCMEKKRDWRGDKRGENQGRAKLTNEQVLEIRRRYAAGEGNAALARAYGLGTSALHSIVRRNTWAHLPEEPDGRMPAEAPRSQLVCRVATPEQIREIRARFAAGPVHAASMAAEYSIGVNTLKDIGTGRRWAHIQ